MNIFLDIVIEFEDSNGSIMENPNAVPLCRKGDHQCVNNCRPVSLLSMFSKIFERLIYNAMFKHLDNNFISSNQSGFKPGDSYINQLVAITHVFLKVLMTGWLEIRGIFLDTSKAFDKVWHEGLAYKLRSNGICGNLLQLSISFLDRRKQRVLLNGQCSSWDFINAGVPQGSILVSLLFLIYVNDLTENLQSHPRFLQTTPLCLH